MEIKTNEKIRVRLESFNHELLMSSCRKIIDLVQSHDINKFSLVSLPTDKRIYCVLRSPHVDKDSREHFEIRVDKRSLEIYYDPALTTAKIASVVRQNLQKLHNPGVIIIDYINSINIKIIFIM